MNEEANSAEGRRSFPISAREIAAVLVIGLLLAQIYATIRDRGLTSAIESYAPFGQPTLPLEFSRKMAYDPLTFLGRGRQAGLWDWTPEGLVLTETGRGFFEASGDQFVSRASAGKRRVTRLSNVDSRDGRRVIFFFYEWTEVTPPAAALLFPAPRTGVEYYGHAVLEQEQGTWKVTSFETQDFDEPLSRLQDIAAGVRR